MVQQHERLKIWQKSYDLAKDLMQVTERFPRPHHGLNCQIAERHPFLRVAFDPVEVTE
jgi:hypothetical protein